jgi:hypothetical protein
MLNFLVFINGSMPRPLHRTMHMANFYFKVLFSFQRTRSTNAFSPPSRCLFPSHLLLFPPDGSKVRDMIYKLDNVEA